MANWLKFRVPRSEEPSEFWIRGVKANVLPSPHDIPELFRTYADLRLNELIIEFKYIDEEPLQQTSSDDLRLWLGRNSHRLYRIGISAGTLKPHDPNSKARFLYELSRALEQLERQPSTASASSNYEFLKSGISNEQNTIFERLAETSG
jgi:hypothetical protein